MHNEELHDLYFSPSIIRIINKVGCLHPVACTRPGPGFPSNATLI
jgi:hypothetical protein